MFSFNFQDDQIEKRERPQILREQMELEVAAFPPAVYIVICFVLIFSVKLYLVLFQKAYA